MTTPKPSSGIDRFLFFVVCGVMGLVAIPTSVVIGAFIWAYFYPHPNLKTKTETQRPVTAVITVNETIRAVWDSGLYTEASSGISWLDNDTVILKANNGPKPTTSEAARLRQTWPYIWRLGEQPRPYGPDPHTVVGLCGARGIVGYFQDVTDPDTGKVKRVRRRGPPGQEREAESWQVRAPGRVLNPESIEKIDCEMYVDPAMAGKVYVTDSERRFYLDFGRDPAGAASLNTPAESIVLIRADGSERTVLPISNALPAENATHFHTFDGTFYLVNPFLGVVPESGFTGRSEKDCWPIWRIHPETATTDYICIPRGPSSGLQGRPIRLQLSPTKAGLFLAVTSVNRSESGYYRLGDDILSRVFAADILHQSTSPNGCRVALIVTDYGDRRLAGVFWSKILAIDLCSAAPSRSPQPN